MKDVILIAGGDNGRRLQLTNKLLSEQHNIAVCRSSEDCKGVISEENVVAVLLLYPDEFGVIDELFGGNLTSHLFDRVPVVFISSSPAENSRVRSLQYRADEFLIEPISSRELLKIINLFGSTLPTDARHVLVIGDLILDRVSATATLRNNRLPLYPLQVRILEFLMLNPGHAFTRQQIFNGIWSEDSSIDERTVDVAIGRIRDALKHKVGIDPIRTVRSVGYAFNEHFGERASLPKKRKMMKRAR